MIIRREYYIFLLMIISERLSIADTGKSAIHFISGLCYIFKIWLSKRKRRVRKRRSKRLYT